MLLLGLLACPPADPKIPADCASVLSQGAKNECYAKVAPELFRTDPEAGIKLVQTEITDTTIQDFVFLKVTREIDPSTPRYCELIQDKVLADRCRVLVSRPHLHRGLTAPEGQQPDGPQNPPGGPPPQNLPGMPPPP
jgi:hypothetical protein